MAHTDTTTALTTLIKILTPLSTDDRHRIVDSAMVFLGEKVKGKPTESTFDALGAGNNVSDNEEYPIAVRKWMQQYSVLPDEFDKVFHLKDDGFDIHGAPGKSRKEKTLNTYILTGAGMFLTTGDRKFNDALARGFCETIGCFDSPNHAKYLKEKGAEFSGDKGKGYTLTKVGEKRGAELVKEQAAGTK
jgi:hypothetical protein